MLATFQSQAFRQSRPVLFTTFINKACSVGLSLIPILLVRRGVSTPEGASVLAALKVALLSGTLLGGWLCNRVSPRTLVLAALAMSAVGLGLMPFQRALVLILPLAVLAQLAESILNIIQRVLLMEEVEGPHQKQALGWLRMANNMAQVISFGTAAAVSSLGVTGLFLLDSAASAAAFVMGARLLPLREARRKGPDAPAGSSEGRSAWVFFVFSLVMMGWSLLYELFLEGGAGRLEVLHPGSGLRRFSVMMVLNTVLCAAFAVGASRFFTRSWTALTSGLTITAGGICLAAWGMASQPWVLAGMLLISVGEIMVGSLAQYTLMRLAPGGTKAGYYYSLGLALMQFGRLAGASLAFPLLIHASELGPFYLVIGTTLAVLLLLLGTLRGVVSRLDERRA